MIKKKREREPEQLAQVLVVPAPKYPFQEPTISRGDTEMGGTETVIVKYPDGTKAKTSIMSTTMPDGSQTIEHIVETY
jgi:hypothetical protein